MSEQSPNIETLLLHGVPPPDRESGATIPPIFQSSAFGYPSAEALEAVFAGREAGYVYTRINNPTVDHFERRLNRLEGGIGAMACASGMAAITATILALAEAGDELVSSNSIFGGTYSLFQDTLSRCGIRTRFVEATDLDAYRGALRDRTKLIFVETIGNPKLDVPDIAALGRLAREYGIALVVDNTVTTPIVVRPKELGADIVVHSASKFISGQGHAIGGVIVDCGTCDWSNPRYEILRPFYRRVQQFALLAALRNQVARNLGGCLAPFNAFLLSMGLETLGVRMERHCANAAEVAAFLAAHPKVEGISYPGLETHPDHHLANRQFSGRYGALVTLRLGTKERCFRFINRLRLVKNLANLGDTRTLVIHPASTLCRDLNAAERLAMGVTDDLVRLSVGIEDPADILDDLSRSLDGL